MRHLSECSLYTFIDTTYFRGRTPVDIAEQLCRGGSDLIQLRAKNSTPAEISRIAEEIQPILRRANVGLVINDHWDIAQKIGADICHLGQEDYFDTPPVRNNPSLLLGLSTHAPAQAQRAIAVNPAYIAIGPIFATPTKPQARPVTLEYVRWAAAKVKIPWFAIGGITLANVDQVIAAGATRICVVSAILDTPDIAATCRRFKEKLPPPSLI